MFGVALSIAMAAADIQPVGCSWPKSEMRVQKIHKALGELDWPFYADSGRIFCLPMFGKPYVYFIPDGKYDHRRAFLLDVDMFQMTVVNFGMNDVMLPAGQPSETVKRLAPFVAMGHMLCKQDKGSVIPGGEL